MSSSENESQTEESSSDKEQENEYGEMSKLMAILHLNEPFHSQARKLKVLKI